MIHAIAAIAILFTGIAVDGDSYEGICEDGTPAERYSHICVNDESPPTRVIHEIIRHEEPEIEEVPTPPPPMMMAPCKHCDD